MSPSSPRAAGIQQLCGYHHPPVQGRDREGGHKLPGPGQCGLLRGRPTTSTKFLRNLNSANV